MSEKEARAVAGLSNFDVELLVGCTDCSLVMNGYEVTWVADDLFEVKDF